MKASKQPLQGTLGNAPVDPEERRRRLGQVYWLLVDLAQQKKLAGSAAPENPSESND